MSVGKALLTDSVVQEWVSTCSWKQQSILFSGLRGSDHARTPAIKAVSKWMRNVSQHNADPTKGYMNDFELPSDMEVCEELEYMTCHFTHHFADALAVIAWNHPDVHTRKRAFAYHYRIAEELFHFIPENPAIFRWRHRDKRDGADPEPKKPYNDRAWVEDHLPYGNQP